MLMSEVSIRDIDDRPHAQRRLILLSPSASIGGTHLCLIRKQSSMTVVLPKASFVFRFRSGFSLASWSFHLCLAPSSMLNCFCASRANTRDQPSVYFVFVESQMVLAFGATDTFHWIARNGCWLIIDCEESCYLFRTQTLFVCFILANRVQGTQYASLSRSVGPRCERASYRHR